MKVQVMKGKLWYQQTDVIVIPCENTELNYESGVAKKIASISGP